ncbi:MAG: DUF6576 domain-containing protein [Bacteroidales bacterium]
MMFTMNNPYGQQQGNFQPRESFSQRFKRFIRTQPVLAILMAQAIGAYILMESTFFYGLIFVLMLYFGGVFLRQYFSDLTLVAVYLSGGVAGFVGYTLMFNPAPDFTDNLLRAAIQGSAVFALLTFIAVAKPDLRIRIFLLMQAKFWHIAALLLTLLLLRRDLAGGGTHLCYLSGSIVAALGAVLFARKIPFGKMKLFNWIHFRREKKFAKYQTIKEKGRPLRDEEYNDIRAERQKKIDEILDKISRSGYDSLTREEKELLFRQSK